MKPEQERLRGLLVDTISLLCKSSLGFKNELKIQGLLGMTIDGNEVFIVHIDEVFPESLTPSRRNVSVGKDAETKLVPKPVAVFNESFTPSLDNALSPHLGSEVVCKRLKMEVQPVKQECSEWEEDASTMQLESSKIVMEDQNAIGNVSGSKTKSSEVLWIDSDVLNDSKDRISLESQPGHGFEASNESVAFDRFTNGLCGSKLYDVPVGKNTSGIIVKREDEKEVKSDISRKHVYLQSCSKRKYTRTVVPVTLNTASASSIYNTDDQWQTGGIVSYPIPTGVFCKNEGEDEDEDEETEQEDYQELSNWRNSQGPNRGSIQNGDREKPFVCQYDGCDKAFYRKYHLVRHQRTKHGKPF